MAIYNVQNNGNAPSEAKVGDHIVTAAGTYEVVDGSPYAGMSKEQLAQAGVGYNPSSGLYSKKVTDVTSTDFVAMDTGNIDKWLSTNNKNAIANLDSAYADNKNALQKTYNSSVKNYEQQKTDVRQNYLDNITNLYEDTYYNNAKALENASARGLTSSGLGNAMVVSGLVDASNQNAYYRASRDNDINTINLALNELKNNYNVDLDSLNAKLSADKNAALSQNEIAYLNALMSLEQYNNEGYNNMLATKQAQDFEREMYLMQLANSGGYGGGYGDGYDFSKDPYDNAVEEASAIYYKMLDSGMYTDSQLNKVASLVRGVENGKNSVRDVADEYIYANSIVRNNAEVARKEKEKDTKTNLKKSVSSWF